MLYFKDGLTGLFVESLCEGFSCVLKPYRKALMELEKYILSNGSAQLTHIQHKIQPFEPVLSAVNSLIKQVRYPLSWD